MVEITRGRLEQYKPYMNLNEVKKIMVPYRCKCGQHGNVRIPERNAPWIKEAEARGYLQLEICEKCE